MWPWYLLLSMLVAFVAAGAWWLSTGKEAPAPVLPAENSLPIPVTTPAPSTLEPIAEQPQAVAEEPASEGRRPAAKQNDVAIPTRVAESGARRPATRTTDRRNAQRSVPPTDKSTAAQQTAGPLPIILYHPQPNRGRVIQLGAFPTRAQAEESWRRITRRYPYLTTKAKMVNTVDVRAIGGGRPTRMYRLQLGTSSQAQSVVICQQLDRAGHSCVVVY
jgi:hypothetical protein